MIKTTYNKTELLQKIAEIPQFVKRDIYTKGEEITPEGIVESKDKYNKEIRLIAVTEEHKYPIIATISKWYKLVQFSTIYQPLAEHFADVEGELDYYFGSSVMKLFPKGEEFKTEDGYKIGLVITNSVNKCLAINLNFCILVNDKKVYLPKLKSFRKIHLGKVEQIATDFEEFLTDIKQSWKVIVDKFSRELTEDDVNNVLAELKLGTRYNKKIRKAYEVVKGTNLKLWDFFMEVVEVISDRVYRKEENRINKLKKIAEVVYQYSLMEVL